MKKVLIGSSLLLLGLFTVSCSSDDSLYHNGFQGEVIMEEWMEQASEYEKPFDRPADTYTYPIEIGSDEYKELSNQGMAAVRAAFEIPVETLKNMSTAGIIQSFDEYPFRMDFDAAYPSMAYSVDVLKNMNLGRELITRKDAGEWVLRYWMTFPVDELMAGKVPGFLRYLIAIPEIAKSMTTVQKKLFMYRGFRKTDSMSLTMMPDPFMCYLFGLLLQSEGYKPMKELLKKDKALDDFLNIHEMGFPVPLSISEINKLAHNFVAGK